MDIPALVTDRLTYLDHPFPKDKLDDVFSFRPENYQFMPKYRAGYWDGWVSLLRGNAVPTGLFLAKLPDLERMGVVFKLKDKRTHLYYRPIPLHLNGFDLRPFQINCLEKMRASSGGLVLNATGTGKTLVAGAYLWQLRGTACFIVDELTLMDQAQKELAQVLGEKVGQVGESIFWPERVTVATIQTLFLHRRRAQFRKWAKALDVVILDEVHLMLNQRTESVVNAIKPVACFGLTATLELKKPTVKVLSLALCGPRLYEYGYRKGVKERFLTQGVVLGVDLCRSHPSKHAMEYSELYRTYIVKSRRRNDVIEGLVREAIKRGKKVILLLDRVAHVRLMVNRLRDLRAETVYGLRKKSERISAKTEFEAGELDLLITNKVFKKGVNLKAVDLIIDAASMKSGNDARQKFGRGVRLNSGKTGLIYLDIGERGLENRFESARDSRRRALKSQGVPVSRCSAKLPPAAVLDKAEELLAKTLTTS